MCAWSITPKRKKKVEQKNFLLQNWRRQAPSKVRKKRDFCWFWWKCKSCVEFSEEYSLYNVIIWHVRFIGNHLNCDLTKSVFLAFKYLTILRPKARNLQFIHFFVFEVVIPLNKDKIENSDQVKSQSVYLWYKLSYMDQKLAVTYFGKLNARY